MAPTFRRPTTNSFCWTRRVTWPRNQTFNVFRIAHIRWNIAFSWEKTSASAGRRTPKAWRKVLLSAFYHHLKRSNTDDTNQKSMKLLHLRSVTRVTTMENMQTRVMTNSLTIMWTSTILCFWFQKPQKNLWVLQTSRFQTDLMLQWWI